MIPDHQLTVEVDGRHACAPFPDRPPLTSDDEWCAAKARTGIEIPDGAQAIAVTVLRQTERWRKQEVRVFVGDDHEDPEGAAEQAAWDHYETTGEMSYVEVAWSWPDAGVELTVTNCGHYPGIGEIAAGFRFTTANRDQWIGLERA